MTTTARPNPVAGRMVMTAVFAVLALVFLVAGIIVAVTPSGSLPAFLGGLPGSTGHHPLRAVGSILVGAVFAVAAWFALKYQSPEGTGTE